MKGMTAPDAWRVLGVEPGATPDEIARAYRARAAQVHPDVGGAREDWDELVQAYAMLAAGGLTPSTAAEQAMEGRQRRWRGLPRWARLVAVSVLGTAVLAAALTYLLRVPGVPWQVRVGLVAYLAAWWVWWLLGEFRRPSLRTLRYYLIRVPNEADSQQRLTEAMGAPPDRDREGPSSRRSGEPG